MLVPEALAHASIAGVSPVVGPSLSAVLHPSGQYTSRFGGHALIVKVVFDVAYIDVERHFAAASARD